MRRIGERMLFQKSNPIVVVPEVQGDHGTPVDGPRIAQLVARGLEKVRDELSRKNTEVVQFLFGADPLLFGRLLECLSSPEPWTLQLEAARIPGNSHHGAKTVRAFEVTEWHTLHIVAQPKDHESRRRGFLCLPNGAASEKEKKQLLEALMTMLRPDLTYKFRGRNTWDTQKDLALKLASRDDEEMRRLFRSRGEVSAQITRVLKRRQQKLQLLELFLEAAGGIDQEMPLLSDEETRAVVLKWANKVGVRHDHMAKDQLANLILLGVVMIAEVLEEFLDGTYGLGEYGYFLRDSIREELRGKELQQRKDRKERLEKEVSRLRAKLEQSRNQLEAEETLLLEKETELNRLNIP